VQGLSRLWAGMATSHRGPSHPPEYDHRALKAPGPTTPGGQATAERVWPLPMPISPEQQP